MPRSKFTMRNPILCLCAAMLIGGAALLQAEGASLPGLMLVGVGIVGGIAATGHGTGAGSSTSDGGVESGSDGGGGE